MASFEDLERRFREQKPTACAVCKGKLTYEGSGIYQCEECGNVQLDAFGKVKKYLDENGIAPIIVIERATGVDKKYIEEMLKAGRLEVPDGSNYYIKCEKCGCDIRYGRYCPDCIRSLAGDLKAVFHADVGEKPTKVGKMHYLNRDRKK